MKKAVGICLAALCLLLTGCADRGTQVRIGGRKTGAQSPVLVGMDREQAVLLLEGLGFCAVSEAGEYSYLTEAGRVMEWDEGRQTLYVSLGKPPGEMPLGLYVQDQKVYWDDGAAGAPVPAAVNYECLFELTNAGAADLFGETGVIIEARGDDKTYLLWLYGLYHDAHWYYQFEDSIECASLYQSEYATFFQGAAEAMTAWDGWIYGLKADGKLVRKRPGDGGEETVLSGGVADFRIADGRIVYLAGEGGYEVWSAAADGGNPSLLLTLDGEGDDARLVGVMGDWVYYYTRADRLRLYRTDGRQTLPLTELGWPELEGRALFRDYSPLIMGDWVVYYGEEEPEGLWRMSADGTVREPVAALRQVRWTAID